MKWQIPAKTFLVGEYAALRGSAAILLTTTPCFEMTLIEENNIAETPLEENKLQEIHLEKNNLQGIHLEECDLRGIHFEENNLRGIRIHPQSPAGLWWTQHRSQKHRLLWQDPYKGQGGLGASSAQFIGAYLATNYFTSNQVQPNLVEAYFDVAGKAQGVKPSGYDVLAQTKNRCVYIHRQANVICSYDWVFKDIAFILLATGYKLTTHTHLHQLRLPPMQAFERITAQARDAFERNDSDTLISAIHGYQQQLIRFKLTAASTLTHLSFFASQPDILAVKGCGALGADVLLLLLPQNCLHDKMNALQKAGWVVLASSAFLFTDPPVCPAIQYLSCNYTT